MGDVRLHRPIARPRGHQQEVSWAYRPGTGLPPGVTADKAGGGADWLVRSCVAACGRFQSTRMVPIWRTGTLLSHVWWVGGVVRKVWSTPHSSIRCATSVPRLRTVLVSDHRREPLVPDVRSSEQGPPGARWPVSAVHGLTSTAPARNLAAPGPERWSRAAGRPVSRSSSASIGPVTC
jgi:hypothetical protein